MKKAIVGEGPAVAGPCFVNEHVFCCGRTRSGKTTWARAYAARWPGPVLFVNTQEERMPRGWTSAGPEHSIRVLVRALRAGDRVDYVPSAEDVTARAELGCLVDLLFRRAPWSPPVLLAVDETHVYAPQSPTPSPLHRIARRGLRWGIVGLWISQRPANVSKDLVTQCARHIIFQTSWEGGYFSDHGIPAEEVSRLLSAGGDYSYVVWDGAQLTGPFREIFLERQRGVKV